MEDNGTPTTPPNVIYSEHHCWRACLFSFTCRQIGSKSSTVSLTARAVHHCVIWNAFLVFNRQRKFAFNIWIHVWTSRQTAQRAQLSLPFCSTALLFGGQRATPSHWEVLELCLASLWESARKSMLSPPGPDPVTLWGGSRWRKRQTERKA